MCPTNGATSSPRLKAAPILGILAVAAVVRCWAIDFCAPGPLCRPDEETVVGIAIQFFGRDLNPHFFDWPTLFMDETATGLVGFFKVGLFLGWFRAEYHLTIYVRPDHLAAARR
jgi:hypothetical protein